jgi:hypothetical protein
MHRIMNDAIGRGVGRDEKGLYIEWDSLRINVSSGVVSLWLGDTKVSDSHSFGRRVDLSPGVTVTIQGLEGRLRVAAD